MNHASIFRSSNDHFGSIRDLKEMDVSRTYVMLKQLLLFHKFYAFFDELYYNLF